MITRSSTLQRLVLPGTLAALLVTLPAFAQPAGGPPAPPMPPLQPPPTTVPGRPDIPNAEVNTMLRGCRSRDEQSANNSCNPNASQI